MDSLRSLFGTLPIVGSDVAYRWDTLYLFLTAVSAFFFVLVIGLMVYFVVKYRAGSGGQTKPIRDHHVLEITWTLVPTLLLLVIFAWGYLVYREMIQAPVNSMEVRVIGKQWSWSFQYDDGKVSPDLVVPINEPVKLIMSSDDVLHSMFIPNFRIKQDVVPGMYTTVWFEPTVTGKHEIYCAEYCGAAHSQMLSSVYVLSADEWARWKNGEDVLSQNLNTGTPTSAASTGTQAAGGSLVDQGAQLYRTKGCVACHSIDGATVIGPSFKGIWGHDVELTDGSKVKVDENYVRESIENPEAKKVKGFETMVMPPFKGQITEPEMNALIAFIKSHKD